MLPDEVRRGVEDLFVALQGEQATHDADDQPVGGESELASCFSLRHERRLERDGVETASHGGVLLWSADTGSHRALAYVIGDAHVVIGEGNHCAFDLPVGHPYVGGLVIVKDQAVQGVNDQRDMGRSRRDSTEYTSLGGVRVNDLGRCHLEVMMEPTQRSRRPRGESRGPSLVCTAARIAVRDW